MSRNVSVQNKPYNKKITQEEVKIPAKRSAFLRMGDKDSHIFFPVCVSSHPQERVPNSAPGSEGLAEKDLLTLFSCIVTKAVALSSKVTSFFCKQIVDIYCFSS